MKIKSLKAQKFGYAVLFYIILAVFIVISLLPIFIMWFSAFRPENEITVNPFSLPSKFTFENIINAWVNGKMGKYFINSVIVVIPRVLGVVLLSSTAGYGFAKLKFFGNKVLFYYILFGLMIPLQAIMIPIYYNLQKMGLINSYAGLFLPVYGLSMPFCVFFMRSFFFDTPSSMIEAARIDGAGEFLTFFKIVIPLAVPAISTIVIFEFMWGWNDFLLPLLTVYNDKYRTLPLGLMYFKTKYLTNYSLIAAGVTISSIPIVLIYILFQRSFIQGLTAGAVKG